MYLSSIYARIICTIVKVFSRILCWDSQKIMSHWDCLRCQISQFWTYGRQISFTLKCFNFGPKYKKQSWSRPKLTLKNITFQIKCMNICMDINIWSSLYSAAQILADNLPKWLFQKGRSQLWIRSFQFLALLFFREEANSRVYGFINYSKIKRNLRRTVS